MKAFFKQYVSWKNVHLFFPCNAAKPFSVAQFLEGYEKEFFKVVYPKQSLLMLVRKKVIPSVVAEAIEDANYEKAKELLYGHLWKNGSVETLREYCEVASKADGYPNMQNLANVMLRNLPQGMLCVCVCVCCVKST